MYNINNINDENNTGDNRGKFSDRLKKIIRDRLKLQKKEIPNNENILVTGGRNILKIFLALPIVVYSVIKEDKKEKIVVKIEKEKDNNDIKKIKVNKIREMSVSSLRKKKEIALKKKEIELKRKEKLVDHDEIKKESILSVVNVDKEEKIIKLQKEIIDLIKKRLVNNINELEILQSELFLLKVVDGDDLYLKECQDKIKNIKKLLSKINSLKEKYDYLKDNYDFEYIYEYNDEFLIDKILELKDLCNSDDIKFVIDNYKLLDEYKFLYLKIDKLQEDTIKYEEYKNQREEELKERNINFEQLKKEVYNVDEENKKFDSFVKKQNDLLKKLDDEISKIDVQERVTYRLKGFNLLVANSFKFLGLMLLNPLKAFIPGIASQTVMTKNVIHNLYNNLEVEKEKKVYYESIDYSNVIKNAKNNINDTLSLVNSTLEDISSLKRRYVQQFSKYQDSIVGYKDTIRKLNKMENAILGNKLKIEIMQEKMKVKEKENKNKLERVKKLNSSSNNS